MALVYVDSDPWLGEHEACQKLYREIMHQLTVRSCEQRFSQTYARLSASIRLRMKQYCSEVEQLKQKVNQAASMRLLTFEEAERRSRLVETLESHNIHLQKLFVDRDDFSSGNRSSLLRQSVPVFADMGTTGWGTDDVEEQEERNTAQNMSVADIQTQREKMIQDQDSGLEALSKVISRQIVIAQTIGNEVDLQDEIIEDLADHMASTDDRLLGETRQIRIVDKKDRTCCYWVIIILLFISIIIVSVVPN